MEPPEVGSRTEVHQPSFQGSELRPEFVPVGDLQFVTSLNRSKLAGTHTNPDIGEGRDPLPSSAI